jgi:predicted outer membrane repeat protein
VSGATFTGNSGEDGGAIFGTASVSVTDSTFTGNSAERGGAVYLQYGKQEITHCQFSGNTATYAGGGLYDDSNITMTGTTFSSNHAEVGGAVSVFDLSSAALAVSGSAFVANTARIGGAIYNYDGLTATDSVFTANHASQGGAVDQDWYATLTGDLFTRNTATASGGGMYAGYTTTVSQSTFARNTAGSHGGGIDNGLGSLNLAGPLVVSGSSVTGNVARGHDHGREPPRQLRAPQCGLGLRCDGHRDRRRWPGVGRGPSRARAIRAVAIRAEAPRWPSSPAPAAGTERPLASVAGPAARTAAGPEIRN